MRALLPALIVLFALPAAAEDRTTRACYNEGFTDGVAAVNAQLGAVTAQMQKDVQAQVNAQLAELDARRNRELEARLTAAQDEALATQGPVRAEGPAQAVTMPRLPPLGRAPGGGIAPLPSAPLAVTPIRTRPDARLPADPSALPQGTTITITNPQNLPPELFRALMDYAAR